MIFVLTLADLLLDLFCKPLRHIGIALRTVEEMPVSATSGFFAECKQQVGAIDAAGQVMTTPPPQPNKRHTIGDNQVRRIQNFLELGIVLRLDDAVHAGGGNGMAPPSLADPFLHLLDYIVDLNRIHADA